MVTKFVGALLVSFKLHVVHFFSTFLPTFILLSSLFHTLSLSLSILLYLACSCFCCCSCCFLVGRYFGVYSFLFRFHLTDFSPKCDKNSCLFTKKRFVIRLKRVAELPRQDNKFLQIVFGWWSIISWFVPFFFFVRLIPILWFWIWNMA